MVLISGQNTPVQANPRSSAQLRADLHRLRQGVTGNADVSGPIEATVFQAVTKGQPVYAKSTGVVDLGDASAMATAKIVGLMNEAGALSATAAYVHSGVVEQSSWTSVIGVATLTTDSVYFMSETEGELTTTAPTGASSVVIRVGIALSTTQFLVQIHQPIQRKP